MELLEFLQETNAKTNNPYFSVMGLKLAFGPTTVPDLNQLRTQGLVCRIVNNNIHYAKLLTK